MSCRHPRIQLQPTQAGPTWMCATCYAPFVPVIALDIPEETADQVRAECIALLESQEGRGSYAQAVKVLTASRSVDASAPEAGS